MAPFDGPSRAVEKKEEGYLEKRAYEIAREARGRREGCLRAGKEELIRQELLYYLVEQEKWFGEGISLTFAAEEGKERIFLEIPDCPPLELRISVGISERLLREIKKIKDKIMFPEGSSLPAGIISLNRDEFSKLTLLWIEREHKGQKDKEEMDVEDVKFQSSLGMEVLTNLMKQAELFATYSAEKGNGGSEKFYNQIIKVLKNFFEREGISPNGERERDIRGRTLSLIRANYSA
jgi:hypothetical protein